MVHCQYPIPCQLNHARAFLTVFCPTLDRIQSFDVDHAPVAECTERLRVLVVDDEPSIVDVVSMALRHHGFDVAAVGTGSGALAQVRDWRPHAMVLDVMLPDMEGFEVGVKGKTIYVTDTSGNTVKVKVSSATKISKSESVSRQAIRPGDTVIISGVPGSGGATNAATITDSGNRSPGSTSSGSSGSGSGGSGSGSAVGSLFSSGG
jgi:CheY-like chemotaxis protein